MVATDAGCYGATDGSSGASRRGGFGGWVDVATLGVVPRATGGALHYLDSVCGGGDGVGRLTAGARLWVAGQVAKVLAAARANETVLKVRTRTTML